LYEWRGNEVRTGGHQGFLTGPPERTEPFVSDIPVGKIFLFAGRKNRLRRPNRPPSSFNILIKLRYFAGTAIAMILPRIRFEAPLEGDVCLGCGD
jgi:hypothetical protein